MKIKLEHKKIEILCIKILKENIINVIFINETFYIFLSQISFFT